ncbi:MAG: glycosyltransferase family 2 protein [Gammaproteobacteria bacterium]
MQLSVVIPMLNEAENAAHLLEEIQQALEGRLDYEIVVVSDGSQDATEEILTVLQAGMPRLNVVIHSHQAGQSAAIVSGVKYAHAPWIATLDGDGQNDPADIPALFDHAMRADAAGEPLLIAGNRRKRNDNSLRRLSSRIANGIRQSLLKDGCADTGCGLKVFPREAFMALPHFDHMHRFLPALFQREHVGVINVPVNHRPRLGGTSKYGVWNRLWVGIVDLFGVFWLQRRGRVSGTHCRILASANSPVPGTRYDDAGKMSVEKRESAHG